MFTEGRAPIPSWPPLRGEAHDKLTLRFQLANGSLRLAFDVFVACFSEQRIITLLAVGAVPEISLDELIFVKQGKWYHCRDDSRHWLEVVGGNTRCGVSYSSCFEQFLRERGAVGLKPNEWPIFDFIELRSCGPAAGSGPNASANLEIDEHWGLLAGDEGYRLIDTGETNYAETLKDPAWRFRGRKDWLYNFSPTSCVAFVDAGIDASRRAWRRYYAGNVGEVAILDQYLGFNSAIPALQDGIPLLVEICLLRYVELRRISELLQREERRGSWRLLKWLWDRKGPTPLERAVTKLDHLDFYQESGLWIIGGEYTDRLYEYKVIRKRVDALVDHVKAINADIGVFYLSVASIIVAIVALVFTWFTYKHPPLSH